MNDVVIQGNLKSSGTLGNARWADPDDIFNRFSYEDGDIWLGRNPHNGDQAIGYKDDRHIMLCAGSRSGKGRSFIINNLALWQGSTVTYDPKGELPVILAARRGKGDEYCDGLGQDVYVLDPLKHSDVGASYLAYFNPLAGLDPNDGEFATWAKRIANALIKTPTGTEGEQWARRAGRFIATVIMHVMTSIDIHDNERTLRMVRKLVLEGDVSLAEALTERAKQKNAEARREGKETRHQESYDPLELLAKQMAENTACRGVIAEEARNILRMVKESSKYFESVRSEAADQLDWLKSEGIEQNLTGIEFYDENGNPVYLPTDRSLDPAKLKSDPNGISVFVVLPVEDLQTYEPWLQVVFMGLFAAMRQTKGKPKSGHQVLAVFDEFSSLGYQEYIINSLDNIAGSGMKMMIAVQNFGTLKERYKDRMESFFTNAGLEIYFGKIGQAATDYLVKELGHTEVVKVARSLNRGENENTSVGKTHSKGESETQTFGETVGESWNWSTNVNYSDSKNWGSGNGSSMGRNYGPHIFMSPSLNYGSNISRNTGGSHTKSRSKTKGGGKSTSTNESKSSATSWNFSTSETHAKGYSIGGGIAESYHRKPLLEHNEITEYLRPLTEDERDYEAYPGFMLVRMQGEKPTFLRRSNYDQDIVFERCFSPDPNFEFLPINEQPLLGYQYTEKHLWDVKLPEELLGNDSIKINVLPRISQWFEDYNPVLEVKHLDSQIVHHTLRGAGRIISISNDEERLSFGSVLIARMAKSIDAEDASLYVKTIFSNDIALIEAEKEQQRLEAQKQKEDADKLAAEENARQAELNRIRQERHREIREKLLKVLKPIGATMAVLIIGFFIYGQIQEAREQAAQELQIQIENQHNAFNLALKDRTERIRIAEDERLSQIRADKVKRQTKIDSVRQARQEKIDAAVAVQRKAQADIIQDRENLQNARASRKDKINAAHVRRQNAIAAAENKRQSVYQNDLSKWQAKVDDEWSLIEQQKQRALKPHLSDQRKQNSFLKRSERALVEGGSSRYIKETLDIAALEIAKRTNVTIGNVFIQKMYDQIFDYDNHLKWRNTNCNTQRSQNLVICLVIHEIRKTGFYNRQRNRVGRNDRFELETLLPFRNLSNEHLRLYEIYKDFLSIHNVKQRMTETNRNISRINNDFAVERRRIENKYRKPQLTDYPEIEISRFPKVKESDFAPVDESEYPLAKLPDVKPVDISQFEPIDMSLFPEINPTDYPRVDLKNFPPIDMTEFPLVELDSDLKKKLLREAAIKY